MIKYILKRLLISLLTITLVVCVVFLLLRLMPSDYFFTEDELIKFKDAEKEAKLERLGMRMICPECHGARLMEDGSLCPRCRYVARCAVCEGDGLVNKQCEACEGTGKIKTRTECATCAGTGIAPAGTDEATAEAPAKPEKCADCRGLGYIMSSSACETCKGSGKMDELIACPVEDCHEGTVIRAGTGYVDRSKFAQLGDFFGSLLEYRAFTVKPARKTADILLPKYEAKAFLSKDFYMEEDALEGVKLSAIKPEVLGGDEKKKSTVYVNLTQGTMTKDATLEEGKLTVKKECTVLEEGDEVPEGAKVFQARASDGEIRDVAIFVSDDEYTEDLIIEMNPIVDPKRKFIYLEEDEAAPEGMTVETIHIGKQERRIALELKEGERFYQVPVETTVEDRTVPFFSYLFAKYQIWARRMYTQLGWYDRAARILTTEPFEGVGDDTTYIRCCFNLGKSMRLEKNQYVIDVIAKKIGPSMEIGLIALAISLVLGVVIGVMQARNHVVDAIGTGYTVMVNAVPHLVIYTIIMMFGAMAFGLPMRYDASAVRPWLTKVLPITCLSIASTAGYMLWTRRYMVDELNKDYIRLARLKGLSETKVMFRHVLKNAFVPLAQYLPYSILLTVGGSLLVEKFFSVPGMGPELTMAISRFDVNLVQGIVLLYATMGILGVFLGDLLMTIIDPRIKLTGKEGVR